MYRDSSEYNKDIRVIIESGKKKLLVNGIQQSGPKIDGFWNFAFANVPLPQKDAVSSILVLGVGGGTVIRKLRHYYPKAKIVGVDIDKAIVEISQSHFGLSNVDRLRLNISDAKVYVAKTKQKFDFVIIDLYIGRDIPAFESSEVFIRNLKRILRPGGHVLFNYLHDGQYRLWAARLGKRLKSVFSQVATAELPYNLFFMAY